MSFDSSVSSPASFAFSSELVARAASASTTRRVGLESASRSVSTERNDAGAVSFNAGGDTNSSPVAPSRCRISSTSLRRFEGKIPRESPAL
jgi:hypothetical protein